jgi:uncharacterized protein (DUF1697 family)
MARYVAFLGAINVGGHVVKMDQLCTIFEQAGCKGVSSFIASGNVIFSTSKRNRVALESWLAKQLEGNLGYKVPTFLRTPDEVRSAAEYDPFEMAEMEATEYRLHVCFLHGPLTEEQEGAAKAASTVVDELYPHGSELYWLCRGTMAQSQLKWKVLAKSLGESTARNVTMLRRLAARL